LLQQNENEKMKKLHVLLIALCSSATILGQEVVNNSFGNGFYNVIAADSSYSMKLAARMQSLYIADWDVNDADGIHNVGSQFLVRRARLKFGGFVFSPKVKYKLELGLSNKDLGKVDDRNNNAPKMILDAVVKWNFYKNFTLWAGQTKLPGNRERVVSSANLQLVDRSLLNKRFNIDRDMGIQLRHHFTIGKNFIVQESLAVSQGEGRNVVQDNLGGYQWTSRIEVLPFGKFKGAYAGGALKREETPKLAIGATYDYNNAVKNKSNQGSYMLIDDGEAYFQTNVNSIFVDAMFKYQGFSFMAEFANRDSKNPIAMNSDGTESESGDVVQVGNGLNLMSGYLFNNDFEITGRYTSIALDKAITGKDLETQYTLGLSKYFKGHKLKVQTDVSYLTVENNGTSGLMYRMQFDLHF
jgi:phosphate-selective porin OprO/OprP